MPHLIQEYNQAFSIPLGQLESVPRKFNQDKDIVFSYRSERIIDNVHSISFKKLRDLYVKTLLQFTLS